MDWLRYRAWPVIALVVALGALEAGYPGNPHVAAMPASYPRLDRAIAADHTRSLVLDVPFGLRGGIPVWGVPFFPQALVMATADGHPRSIAYVSRVPRPTIAAMHAHPFYRYLVEAQHQVPRMCPWSRTWNEPPFRLGCMHAPGVVRARNLRFTGAQLAGARQDATRMRVRWAVVWKRNLSVDGVLLPYLRATGFRYAYRDHNWLVYKARHE